ncbi:MAG: membrane associated rhomboid family serine protease, partial [Kiritimatiellia bacterium]
QGPQPFSLLMNLVMVYFFLPWLVDRFTRRDLLLITASTVAGCFVAGVFWSALAMALNAGGLLPSLSWLTLPSMGWGPLVLSVVALFGLSQPNATINLMFVMPMKAIWIVWLSLAASGLFFLAQPGMGTFEPFGAIGGAAFYWFFIGGGARTRRLKSKGRKIEKDLRFKVYEGGRQGDQDEWIN